MQESQHNKSSRKGELESAAHFHWLENDPDAKGVEGAGEHGPREEGEEAVCFGGGECFFPEEPEGEEATGVEEEDFEGGEFGEAQGGDVPIREG